MYDLNFDCNRLVVFSGTKSRITMIVLFFSSIFRKNERIYLVHISKFFVFASLIITVLFVLQARAIYL